MNGTAEAQLQPLSPWPTLQYDLRHTGQSPLMGPLFPSGGPPPASVKSWLGFDKIKMSPVIGADGTIYVGLGFQFCALNPATMTLKWVAKDVGRVDLPPDQPACAPLHADVSANAAAIGLDGTIYVGDRDNSLSAFNPDGSLKWRYNNGFEGDILTSPAIAPAGSPAAGTIYFVHTSTIQGAGVFTALNPDKTVKWTYVLGNFSSTSSPAIDKNGIIYFGDATGFVYAFKDSFDPSTNTWTPDRKWKTQVGTRITASPVISADSNRLFIGSTFGLAAITLDPGDPVDPPGTVKWTYPASGTVGMVDQTPALANDGTLYFGGKTTPSLRTVYAINSADGSLKWSYGPVTVSFDMGTFPIVAADGIVYVGLGKGLYAFTPDNGSLLWSYQTTNFIISSPAIGGSAALHTGGPTVVYIGSQDWRLYAISGTRTGTDFNVAPVAVATANPTTVQVGDLITFNGSGTHDDNGDPLAMTWDFGDGTQALGVLSPTHTYWAPSPPGGYTAKLTVNDGLATSTDSVNVTVNEYPITSVQDNFNRGDSDSLGLGWVESLGSLSIAASQLRNAPSPSGYNIALREDLLGADQTAQACFTSANNNAAPRLGVVLRFINAQNHYRLYRTAGGASQVRIARIVNGIETILASAVVPQLVVGVPFLLEGRVQTSQGTTTLTLILDGVPKLSVSDSTYPGGRLGLVLFTATPYSHTADNFCGAVGTGTCPASSCP
jgi:hypothetical protein